MITWIAWEDLSRYRNALCYARLKGGRVEAEPEARDSRLQSAVIVAYQWLIVRKDQQTEENDKKV